MYIKYIFSLLILFIHTFIQGQTFCLNFSNAELDKNELTFDISMSGSNPFKLGSSNLQFGFNAELLSNPVIISHNFTASYAAPTITTPLTNQASLNIHLLLPSNGINIPTSYTTLARVKFTTMNNATMANLVWSYNGGTTQTVVFNDPQPATQVFATVNNTICLQPSNILLPLHLLDFKTTTNTESIDLEWWTDREDGVSHFEILRSTDGHSFKNITKIVALGNSGRSNYQYSDQEVIKGIEYYYKLKIVDFDGYEEFSSIKRARINQNQSHIYVYPNPVGKNMNINISSDFDEPFNFTLFDSKGSVILNRSVQKSSIVNSNDLHTGIYFYRVENKDMAQNGRIVILN